MNDEITTYSENVPGDEGNYNWSVRFDKTGRLHAIKGYIGISQEQDGALERILLSPSQAQSLAEFILREKVRW